MTTANIRNLDQARANLSRFVIMHAEQLRRTMGFGYADADDAPGTFEELQAAWEHSRHTGLPLKVWTGGSENTIYTSKGANYAFRFWHDTLHMALGLGFTTKDEMQVGYVQTKVVQDKFGKDSLESLLMLCDTVGQTVYHANNNGAFPENQLSYVVGLLETAFNKCKAAA